MRDSEEAVGRLDDTTAHDDGAALLVECWRPLIQASLTEPSLPSGWASRQRFYLTLLTHWAGAEAAFTWLRCRGGRHGIGDR